MTQKRYRVICLDCGTIEADTDDGYFSRPTAERRAGHHEGSQGHQCDVEVAEKTKEYRCPVCHTLCVGERERDDHAQGEPGVDPSSFVRV